MNDVTQQQTLGRRRALEPAHGSLLVGCGKLGLRLAELLAREGETVFAIRRHARALPSYVTAIASDVTKPLPRTLPPVESMVVTLPPSVDPAGYRPVLRRIRDALDQVPARTVFVSSTGVFEGWDGPQPITEHDVPRPATARAQALRDGELAAAELFDALIVRPAGIYGPGRDFLVRTVRKRRPITSAARTNRIHETDLVRALHALLRSADPPRVLHAVDAAPARLGDVTDYISELVGAEPPPESEGPGRAGNVFDGAALRRLLGDLRYPSYREGYRDMLEGGTAPPSA
ncbi:sugar nucleotide-binding protein [Demequina sp. SYSU T00192]|uniref:Sugar nucleotide-binding protein n=1 Tax=Demequina litoralis TaxID=3051660 RepID=A0ABT8GBC9_9MICO|nr:sugar nucleotide-binding protein [Demequina sp. SYSU T00192]MDN4476450.1 sugar nucleotide-binding protein [Demequina sp. SYSU T00192]